MAGSDSLTRLYARSPDIITTDVAGEAVLLNTKSWCYFEFDKTGGAIWALLEVPRSLPSLVDALLVEFRVDRARCLADTSAFLDDMIAQGCVTTADGRLGRDPP